MTHLGFFAILALLACPAAYFALCVRMRISGVQRPPYVPFFFLFGTLGGWLLGLALSPSGLAAVCLLFLVSFAPLSTIVSSIYLAIRSKPSRYHRVAMWSGFAYPALLAVWLVIILVFGS